MTLRAGRYELLDTIASGGMATVHLGRAVGAGGFERLVAIKTMHPHLSNEPEFVSMFLDEARLAARIRHPNVVGTIDIQQDELGLLLVMEYIEGPSMGQVVKALGKQKKTLPLDIAVRIMLDVLAGLHAAHELCGPAGEPLNVVHRDVSPQNILVGVDGIARIMDFGVARAEARIATTRGGDAKGKVSYMAPEQARMADLDRRADVFAAGIVFWEFLTGRRLFRGDNDLAIMNQLFNSDYKRPRDVVESVPQELSDVVMRALARERDERFPTTAAFADAVDSAARAAGVVVATPRAVGAFVRELQIHKAPTDLPSGLRSLPAAPSIQSSPNVAAASTSSGNTPATKVVQESTVTASGSGFAATPPTSQRPAPTNRKLIYAGAAATLVLSAIGGFVVAAMSSNDKPSAPVAGASAEPRASVEPVASAIARASAEPPHDAAPVASAAVAASAAPPAETSAAQTATSKPRTPTVNTGITKSPTAPSPKTFIPKEL